MYKIRCITSDSDLDQMRKIWFERNKRMRTVVEDQEQEFNKALSNGVTVGAFDDNEVLIGFMRYHISAVMPFANIYHMHIKKGTLNLYDFSNEQNPITPILDFILTALEEKEIYTWYYVRPISQVYHKIYKDQKDLFFQSNKCYDKTLREFRYERFVDEMIEKNSIPSYKSHQLILGDRKFINNIIIVKCCLKQKFRKYSDIFDNEQHFL